MTRRLWLAWVGLVLATSVTRAQMPFSKDLILTRPALGRIGLEQNWTNVIPIGGRGEKVLEVSIDDNLVFAQTNLANFHVFDSESGRLLWSVNLGRALSDAHPASANSYAVYVSNSNTLFALDRIKGRVLWELTLDALPSSPTVADDERVSVGLLNGKLETFNAKNGKYLWNAQTGGEIESRPHPAGRIIVFASKDGKLYASRADISLPLYRWTTGGPVTAPLGAHGTRTLLVPSTDKSLYAVDLFTGETKWNYPSGAPIEQEPLVAGDDVFVVNREGILASINANSGELNWQISTLGGPLLGVTTKRVYLESRDGDLFIVDRATGQMLFDPRATHERAGVNIREFHLGPTNRLNDRIYIASKSGMLTCLRETGAVRPVPLRDPKLQPFGYIPPEGYPDRPVIPPAPIANPDEPKPKPEAEAEAPK
jgi:outer membrane protein assembly factor BamB